MIDTLQLNLIGRVMLVARRYGISEQSRLRVLARAIMEVVRHRYPDGAPSLKQLDPLLETELGLLDQALQRAADARHKQPSAPERQRDAAVENTQESRQRRHKQSMEQGAKWQSKSMEDKLQDERKPLQKLLTEDCVNMGLIDKDQAQRMARSMPGKVPHEAEQAIVEVLRQNLQDQVRAAIRHYKGGGPWSTPKAQDDIRRDIHSVRSVKSVLSLARQIVKEQKVWETEHGKGGVLGLFSRRKKITGRPASG